MLDFENIISFESLYKAHRRARLGKRHKKEVILFEANLSENLWALHYDLKYGKYEVGGYHKFMIYDPKEREIQAISYRDRIVQHSLCDNYLMPLLNRHLIYDNAACRKEKGTSFAIKRFRKFMCEHYKKYEKCGYFVKLDISKYFPSIDHGILKLKLRKVVDDEKILELLYKIIDSYEGENGKGLPMGNQSSQCFALLYLNDLDKFYKEKLKVKQYIRYMDDIIIITHDRTIASEYIRTACELLKKDKLILNPKSQIIKIDNGINFIGWHFFYGKNGKIIQKVCIQTKKNILRRVKKIRNCRFRYSNSAVSYNGYLSNGKNYHFNNKIQKYFMQRMGKT